MFIPYLNSGVWTPAQITTALWLDADDEPTVISSLGKVSEWRDKSGNLNHATQVTEANQPSTGTVSIGGLNAIEFDAVAKNYLSVPHDSSLNFGTDGVAIFTIFRYKGYVNNGSGFNCPLSKGGVLSADAGWSLRTDVSDVPVYKYGVNGSVVSSTIPVNDIHMISANRPASNYSVYADGSLDGSSVVVPNGDTAVAFEIGRQTSSDLRYGHVDIGEIIIMNANMSDAERQIIEGYLAWKWSGGI